MSKLNGPEIIPDKVNNAVIFMHGLGSNGDDLLSLAPLFSSALPDTAFLSPNAPLSVPFAANGYQWFAYWDRTQAQIRDGIDSATPLLRAYILDVATRFNIDHDRIILCGFSQGTMMALHTGLRITPALGGIIGFSGALPGADDTGVVPLAHKPPVLLVHGLVDDVVPAQASAEAVAVLTAQGFTVEHVEIPGLGHGINDTGIRAAIRFCTTHLNEVAQ